MMGVDCPGPTPMARLVRSVFEDSPAWIEIPAELPGGRHPVAQALAAQPRGGIAEHAED